MKNYVSINSFAINHLHNRQFMLISILLNLQLPQQCHPTTIYQQLCHLSHSHLMYHLPHLQHLFHRHHPLHQHTNPTQKPAYIKINSLLKPQCNNIPLLFHLHLCPLPENPIQNLFGSTTTTYNFSKLH